MVYVCNFDNSYNWDWSESKEKDLSRLPYRICGSGSILLALLGHFKQNQKISHETVLIPFETIWFHAFPCMQPHGSNNEKQKCPMLEVWNLKKVQ